MKKIVFSLLLILCLCPGCGKFTHKEEAITAKGNYIFFLHSKFIEENDADAVHPEFGKAAYDDIVAAFEKEGFTVLSERRDKNTDVREYARGIVSQIDSLLQHGTKEKHITVIGTSKGGYIAQYVSTYLANPHINYVFIASFQETDITVYPDINYCGNILTIYEKSDSYGVSAIRRKKTSRLRIGRFKEIVLDTGLGHGFLFRPLKEWMEPCRMWALGQYNLE